MEMEQADKYFLAGTFCCTRRTPLLHGFDGASCRPRPCESKDGNNEKLATSGGREQDLPRAGEKCKNQVKLKARLNKRRD